VKELLDRLFLTGSVGNVRPDRLAGSKGVKDEQDKRIILGDGNG
jgi:hypothetical protein